MLDTAGTQDGPPGIEGHSIVIPSEMIAVVIDGDTAWTVVDIQGTPGYSLVSTHRHATGHSMDSSPRPDRSC